MSHRRLFVLGAVVLAALSIAALAATRPAVVGTVSFKSLEYPRSPETVTIGETFPVVIVIDYADLKNSDLTIHFAYTDHPPSFQAGGSVHLNGSGTYRFPPCELMVPAEYSMPGGWPKYVNEWHLTAEIWKGDQKLGGKAFTVLVENPKYKPTLEITQIEYVAQPDTIAVGEETLVRIHTKHAGLDPNTKLEVSIADYGGMLKTMTSQPLQPKGTRVFGLKITPRTAGQWVLEARAKTVNGSAGLTAKKDFVIKVVQAP